MSVCEASLATPRTRPVLTARTVLVPALDGSLVERMFGLLVDSFAGVDRKTFEGDLQEKTAAVLLEDAGGALHGFSTFLMYGTRVGGHSLTVVCSGDTIVEPSSWGSHALPRAWIRGVHGLQHCYPEGELYWLLLTSGYRTYRFLPLFCRCFYPRHDAPPSPANQALLAAVSAERFGPLFDPAAGVVRFPRPQVLRDGLREVPAGRMLDPHVRFFLQRNPGHLAGDELVSLASLADDNLTAAARRMMR